MPNSVCETCHTTIYPGHDPKPEPRGVRIGSPGECAEFLKKRRTFAGDRMKSERLIVIGVDAQNRVLKGSPFVASVGSLNTTRTLPREIFAPLVPARALAFVMAHNHPSGSLEPSRDDIEFTRTIQRSSEIMGISLYDHLIISARGFVSLKERGIL